MSDKNTISTKQLGISGILLALTVLTLAAATFVPTNRLSLYALSSFYISIIIMEYGIKSGWVFYLASCLTALILVPGKLGLIPYVMFFGIYGIAKYYIEKLGKITLEYILKLLFFNLFAVTAVFFLKQFLPQVFEVGFPFWLVLLGLEVVFVIYDYVYSLFIQYYINKLKRILKI